MAELPQRVETIDPNQTLDGWMIINKSENSENEEEDKVPRKNEQDESAAEDKIENNEGEEEMLNRFISDDIETKSAEDSDISVIEADYDSAIVERRRSRSCHKSDIAQLLERVSTISQSGSTKNVIIVCLLAIIIAMGVDRSLKVENPYMLSNGVDFRLENKMLMDHLKELNKVLTQMKPYISKLSATPKVGYEKHSGFEKSADLNSTSNIPEVLLQSSLNSLCSIINGMQTASQPVIGHICESRGVIFNLIEFKNVVNSSIHEFQQLKNPTINQYLHDMDRKLSQLCQSLLNDVSGAVDRLILKVYNRLNKANGKLNKWVCAVKGNKMLYDAFLTSFDKNNITLEGCEDVANSTRGYVQRPRNYVEGDYASNVTFEFWRKDELNMYREQKLERKRGEKKCDKRKRSNESADKSCQETESEGESFGPFDPEKGRIPNSPWNAVKSFKSGKSRKPHKMKGKSSKKERVESAEMRESGEEEARNKYDRKEAKYRKYGKKGKKCSNKKCKKAIKYTNRTRSVDPMSPFDERYLKKKKSRNGPFKTTINTAPHYSKTIILTTERKSGSDGDDLFRVDINADWQWERNEGREAYRRFQNEPSDWYFERANSRKHARKDAFIKKHPKNTNI